jgi:hypothetical protein
MRRSQELMVEALLAAFAENEARFPWLPRFDPSTLPIKSPGESDLAHDALVLAVLETHHARTMTIMQRTLQNAQAHLRGGKN